MTIDEAIKYCLEVAEHNEALIKRGYAGGCNSHDCSERAENHRQFAEWLTELREQRYAVGVAIKEAQVAIEKRDKMLRDTVVELVEAKRLLKLALQDLAEADHCGLCKHEPDDIATCQRKPLNCFVWRYADEAMKLIGGEQNE